MSEVNNRFYNDNESGKIEEGDQMPESSLKKAKSGPQGLAWTYYTRTIIDRDMREAGILLWDRPHTFYKVLPLRILMMGEERAAAPAIVEHNDAGNAAEPRISFDVKVVRIVPHFPPWEDVHSDVAHPDFLPSFKLAEYQACEVSGYRVWRHNRECIECAWDGCRNIKSDFNPDTRICIGCGPKSWVRYCCYQHELEDIKNH